MEFQRVSPEEAAQTEETMERWQAEYRAERAARRAGGGLGFLKRHGARRATDHGVCGQCGKHETTYQMVAGDERVRWLCGHCARLDG